MPVIIYWRITLKHRPWREGAGCTRTLPRRRRGHIEHEPVLVLDEEFKDLLRELVFLRGHFVIGVIDQTRTEYYSKI